MPSQRVIECAKLMKHYFGTASEQFTLTKSDEEVIPYCVSKVGALISEEEAKKFNDIK